MKEFIKNLKSNPITITFAETMEVIENNYIFTLTAFTNGELKNKAG